MENDFRVGDELVWAEGWGVDTEHWVVTVVSVNGDRLVVRDSDGELVECAARDVERP